MQTSVGFPLIALEVMMEAVSDPEANCEGGKGWALSFASLPRSRRKTSGASMTMRFAPNLPGFLVQYGR